MPRAIALILLGLALLVAGSAAGQDRKNIFADPENLEVLPKDIAPEDLRATMKEFAMSLGVRCETCHVGEAGEPLESFDFAADEKETKQVAREMLQMVEVINDKHIGLLTGGSTLKVRCMTCHRGVRRPESTGYVVNQKLEDEGIEAALATYRELRQNYHGTHSYDFSESVLGDLAQQVAHRDPAAAMKLLELNDEFHPDSFQNHWLKGEVALKTADRTAARAYFERALAIGADPRSEAFLRRRLESIAK